MTDSPHYGAATHSINGAAAHSFNGVAGHPLNGVADPLDQRGGSAATFGFRAPDNP